MKMKKMALLKLVLIGLVSFNIAACGDENMLEGMADKDSDAAKREEVRIAMDNGDYALAIELLEAQFDRNDPDPDIALELANAYMGNAGFSMLDLIEASDALIQGISILEFYWGDFFKKSKFLLFLLIFSMVFNYFILILVALIGLTDIWFNFRKIYMEEIDGNNLN